MTDTTKTADKCAKCGVTNPISYTKCRRCGKTLQWANGTTNDAAPTNAPAATASAATASAATASAATTPNAPSSTGLPNSAPKSAPSGKVPLTGFVDELSSGANRPPQVYSGGNAPIPKDDVPLGPPKNLAPLYAGGVAGALVLLFLLFRLIAPKPVAAIADFEMHTTKGNTFQVLAPASGDWEMKTGAREDGLSGGSRWANGSAKVNVAADQAGSFMSETMKRGDKTPQQTLHEMQAKQMSETYGDYAEEPSRKFNGGFGETWVCEFSAGGSVRAGRLRGMRATMLTNQNRIQFIATCRESDWDKLKPGFQKMLESLAPPGSPPPVISAPTDAPATNADATNSVTESAPIEAPSG